MRVVFLTDIHIGATAEGFQMQPRWIEGMDELLARFAQQMEQLRPDLVIVGGDSVERGQADQIEKAAAFLGQIHAPVLVCLGNHDLTTPASMALWRRRLAELPRVTLGDAMIETALCDFIALNVHWLDSSGHALTYWTMGQYPLAALSDDQTRRLDEWLGRRGDRPAVLALHAQLNGVPGEWSGGDAPFEPPPPAFEQSVRQVIERHPRLRLTLSGHCHATCAIRRGQRVELTAASFTETPHQYQVIELHEDHFQVLTQSLLQPGSPAVVAERGWVCGRPEDQNFTA